MSFTRKVTVLFLSNTAGLTYHSSKTVSFVFFMMAAFFAFIPTMKFPHQEDDDADR